jgi:hypothetical protein
MEKHAEKSRTESKDAVSVYFRALRQESERGKILLLAGKLDELLCQLLQAFFKPHRGKKDDDKLFMPMGPLGSFSSHIEMAYRVGLISKATADCFDILRQIRNDCAHGIEPFSMEHGKHSQQFEKFKTLSFTLSGMGKFLELVERVSVAQDPTSKEVVFLILVMVHILLLQSTLTHLQGVADNFCNLETVNFLPSELSHILKKPQ